MTISFAEMADRAQFNLARICVLNDLTGQLVADPDYHVDFAIDDIRRAIVVYLHATLKDFLRNLTASRLPLGAVDVLRLIPFVGGDGLKTTLTLGDLHSYRGRLVDEVIVESVGAYLDKTSYNNVDDLAKHLKEMGLRLTILPPHAASLATLMARGHYVAHRVDYDDVEGDNQHRLHSITCPQVVAWYEAVSQLIGELRVEVDRLHSVEKECFNVLTACRFA